MSVSVVPSDALSTMRREMIELSARSDLIVRFMEKALRPCAVPSPMF